MTTFFNNIRKYKYKKIHIFDILVFLAILVVGLIFLYNKFTKKSIWIDAKVMITNYEWWWDSKPPPYWMVDNIMVGDISYNTFGEEIAEVTNVEIFSLGGPSRRAVIDVKIKVSYDKKRGVYLYNFRPIYKGRSIDLVFGSSNVNGLLISLGEDNQETFKKRVKVRMVQLENWLASTFREGMEMKDSQGNVVAHIDSVQIKDSIVSKLSVMNGSLYEMDVDYKDVIMEVTISTFKDDFGNYNFIDGASLKPGQEIWFQFTESFARTEIMEIIE